MCASIDDQWKSTLHGWFPDRPADRDNKGAWNTQQIIGRIDESSIWYEGIHEIPQDQDDSMEKCTSFIK